MKKKRPRKYSGVFFANLQNCVIRVGIKGVAWLQERNDD